MGKAMLRGAVPAAAVVLAVAFAARPAAEGDTGGQPDVVAQATAQLIAGCLHARGFRYPVAAPDADPRPAPEQPFGTDDVAQARAHGFGLDELAAGQQRIADAQRRSPLARYVDGLAPAEQARFDTALHGDPWRSRITAPLPTGGRLFTSTRGCWADAERRLYPDRLGWFRAQTIADALPGMAIRRAHDDARYVAARTAWSACLARAGVRAPDPDALVSATAGRIRALPAPARTRIERDTATIAATCSAATGLTRTGEAARAAALARLHLEYRAALSRLEAQRRVAVQRAAAVVGGTR